MAAEKLYPLEGLSILVVEDEIVFRHQLVTYLSQQGARVNGVENGQLAVDYCQDHKPDVVVMDIVMPELDGIGLLEHIGSGPWAIIVISGKGKFKHLQQALSLGACDYLIKPIIHFDHLIETILNNLAMLPEVKAQQEQHELEDHIDALRHNDIENTRLMEQLVPEQTIVTDNFLFLYRMQGSSLLPLHRQLDGATHAIVLADLAGVGDDMPIAAVILHSILNELWDKANSTEDMKGYNPDETVEYLNDMIRAANLHGNVGLIYGVVSSEGLLYANAGLLGLTAPFQQHHADLILGLMPGVLYSNNHIEMDDSGINFTFKNIIEDRISFKILPFDKSVESEAKFVSLF